MSSQAPPNPPPVGKGGKSDVTGCLRRSSILAVVALGWLGINALIPAPRANVTPVATSAIPAAGSGTATRVVTVVPVATPLPSPTVRR
ncbi:MAG TPA: hypothetical protein VF932_09495 [Anaerolineae bacterium]